MTEAASSPPRILSGVQPSGRLHLGNYFGAIQHHIELQDEGECYFFIANYHSLTTIRDAALLDELTRDVAVAYLAVGLDPARTAFYRQSDVPEVCELTWLLETVTGMGLLERAHSYKEKAARGITPSVGLYTYPVLMAADILAPQADLVPVGQDQDQHVQMTRDMAQLFNNAFAPDDPVFKLPACKLGKAPRVPGTTFEKGAALQVVVELAEQDDSRTPTNPGHYVAWFRERMAALLAGAPEEALRSTEDLEKVIAEWPTPAPVQERILRVASDVPTEDTVVTARTGGIGVEFWVRLDRVVFLTKAGRRQPAKMSKSYGNAIDMFGDGKPLKKAVMAIETRLVDLADPLDHQEDIVFALYSLLADAAELTAMRQSYERGGFGFGNAKKALLAKINEHFEPFRARRNELEKDPSYVEDVLLDGAKRARRVARETVERARVACGIGRYTEPR